MTVIAALSHKGGTGRSVAMCNVAFHLAQRGDHVCLVDLDLASSTLGAVIGLDNVSDGMPRGENGPLGIGDFIAQPAWADRMGEALHTAWSVPELGRENLGSAGRLELLPGSSWSADQAGPRDVVRALRPLLEEIQRDGFDHVLIDVRSGLSSAMAAMTVPDLQSALDGLLLFFRWTSQHLVGLRSLVEWLPDGTPWAAARTAVANPQSEHLTQNLRETLRLKDDELWKAYRVVDPEEDKLLGSIPLEPVLQWREKVLTLADEQRRIASHGAIEAFRGLAETVTSPETWYQ